MSRNTEEDSPALRGGYGDSLDDVMEMDDQLIGSRYHYEFMSRDIVSL
jgi:hypothetical protein